MPWSTPFDDPIALRSGRRLRTLQEAADYIMQLPEAEQQDARWQTAIETLIKAAESGGGKRAAKETVKEAPKKAEKPVRSAARTKKAG